MASRRATFIAGLAGVLCGALLFAIPAMAGIGDNLIIGALNKGNKTTTLDGTVDGPLFKVFNHQGGGSAAVRINSDGPPFATNSTKRVLNFNSDLLDGLHGRDYQNLVAFDHATSVSGGNGVKATASIDAPTSGTLLISAAIDINASGVMFDTLGCELELNSVNIDDTDVEVSVDGATNIQENPCAVVGAVDVAAGSHDVDLVVTGHSNAFLNDTFLTVLFVPTGVAPAQADPPAEVFNPND